MPESDENTTPKPARGAPRGNKNSQTHGISALKNAVKRLGKSAIDRRTAVGKALVAWRSDLIRDLGGAENLSAMQMTVLDTAVRTRLILDSVDRAIIECGWLTNRRKRAVFPIVRERQQIADSLVRQLQVLGIERRQPRVPTLAEYLAQRNREIAAAEPPAPQ